MSRTYCEAKLQTLVNHAWDKEVDWRQIQAWSSNFTGEFYRVDVEQSHALLALCNFVYFSRRLVREMLRSLYRDKFESRIIQAIRRRNADTKDAEFLRNEFQKELQKTRFIGIGNPSESGAHLLYFFRQINRLPKANFADLFGAFMPWVSQNTSQLKPRDPTVRQYVFFDDLVGSGTQASQYLEESFAAIRAHDSTIDISFLCLFATTAGLKRLNGPSLFAGKAECLFELDRTYRAFSKRQRYFRGAPEWFELEKLFQITRGYGRKLKPRMPIGYKRGQLLLGFSHNTPDNVPPMFWVEGQTERWSPVFIRYEKVY